MSAILKSPMFSAYSQLPGHADEMIDAGGDVHGTWQYLAEALDAMGMETLRQRHHQARRLLRERGVTYNVYDDPQGLERSWDLDPVPVLIGSDEWSAVEYALQRRAELFNLILKDLYGPQELLQRGLLPPELVYSHPGFLRPCHPYDESPIHPLTLYAADLVRGRDGRFVVVGDRTQAPSGAGYALENRVVMTRALPSLFRESHVHRLALFFQNLRASLAALAPNRDHEDPNVVVLTPGPLNETYFEHSFLASYLGYTLVEGSDLQVRDGRVWLRSMGRLEPVDVILRRMDDDFCDALELRQDSLLGVPGLTEVVRRGRVAIANPLGSGVLENPALNAFLPAIGRYFLGQEPEMPSPTTWWCGDPDSRNMVLDRLDHLIIRPIHRYPGYDPVYPGSLSAAGRDSLVQRIRAAPNQFTAQELSEGTSVPTLGQTGLEPRQTVLRSFLVARQDGYAVMPGGLTRVASRPQDARVSNQTGGLSKDTWVVASEPVRETSLLSVEGIDGPPTDRSAALPPAATENLFWLARYAERAEYTIRLVRVVLRLYRAALDDANPVDQRCLNMMLMALGRVTGTQMSTNTTDIVAALLPLLQDRHRTGSVAFNMQSMLAASHAVRDRLSPDTWRVIGAIRARLAEMPQPLPAANLGSELDELVTLLAALRGLQDDTMVHSQAWSFLEMGRSIERGLLTSALLRATMARAQDPALESQLLEAVLSQQESLNAYRRQHHAIARPASVLQLVLASEDNPRAVGYQLARLEADLEALRGPSSGAPLSPEARQVVEARTAVRLSDPGNLLKTGNNGIRKDLDQLLARTSRLLSGTSDSLAVAYFTDPQGPRQLAIPDSTETGGA